MNNHNRILITGDAGRGKSTLAEKLSKRLSIPCHSTDDYFYEIKFSKPRNKQESVEMISKLYKEDRWIVEGTTRRLIEPGLESANIIIYLHYKNILSQWFAIFKRSVSRKNETIKGTFDLMKHVFYKRYGLGYKKGVATHMELVEPYKNKLVILSSFKEINNFVNDL